jgi:hypothetical protein
LQESLAGTLLLKSSGYGLLVLQLQLLEWEQSLKLSELLLLRLLLHLLVVKLHAPASEYSKA